LKQEKSKAKPYQTNIKYKTEHRKKNWLGKNSKSKSHIRKNANNAA
jgi:hypothetical protein